MRPSALCARHGWVVVGLWAVCLLSMGLVARTEGAHFDTGAFVSGSDSKQAIDLAGQALGGAGVPDTESVVVHARHGTVDDPLVRAQIGAMVTQLGKLPKVSAVVGPFAPGASVVLGVEPVSTNRHTAVLSVLMKGSAISPDQTADARLITAARAYNGPDVQVEVAGAGATAKVDTTITLWPILVALAAALMLLSVTLRSRVAVLVCAVTGGVATLFALTFVMLLSHAITMTVYAPLVGGVVATGTSLGGALVVVHRAQSRLRDGAAPEVAVRAAARMGATIASGGFCVFVATVAVAAVGLPFFDNVALGSASAGAATGLVTVTLLPALLTKCGPRLLGWTERSHLRASGRGLNYPPGLRTRWARLVRRRPLLAALGAGLVLVAFAVPALTLTLGGSDDGAESTSSTTRRAYDLISADYFTGLNGPMVITVDKGHGPAPVTTNAVVTALSRTPGVKKAELELDNTKLGLALIRLYPDAGPRDPAAVALLHQLRDQVLPRALAGSTSQAHVGGSTAIFVDMAAKFQGATTEFLVVVLLVVTLFGLLTLQSLMLGAALAVASVLAMLASAGALALLFQTSLATSALGLASGPVEPTLLVIVLAAVFGLLPGLNLSLLARLTERPDAGVAKNANIRLVTGPVQRSHADVGHVALAMNLVMMFLFAALTSDPARMMKVIGCGLATGLAIDAFVLRATLLPALVHLLGPRLPRRAASREAVPAAGRRRGTADRAPTRTGTARRAGGFGRPTVPIRFLGLDRPARYAAAASPLATAPPDPATAWNGAAFPDETAFPNGTATQHGAPFQNDTAARDGVALPNGLAVPGGTAFPNGTAAQDGPVAQNGSARRKNTAGQNGSASQNGAAGQNSNGQRAGGRRRAGHAASKPRKRRLPLTPLTRKNAN